MAMTDRSKALPKMSTSLAKTLGHRNFDPEKFANSISAQSDGDKDLQENRQRIQALGDETAQILKKQVYHNYQQFIDTAKEISFLEGEMFQLNHILTEQKHLMEQMTSMFASKGSDDLAKDDGAKQQADKEQEQRKVMSALHSKLDGCANILEVPERFLVHDGDVVELDTDSFSPMGKIHLFLFNDCVMVTTWVPARRGSTVAGKYKFQVLWEFDTVAVVNARDVGQKKVPAKTVKNAFKVLMFPDARMFQCENAKEKREWLEIMDATKRDFLNQKDKKADPPTLPVPISPLNAYNPFAELEVPSSPDHAVADNSSTQDERLHVDWLQEMPEDLDVYIAQRNFEQAVDLIGKTKTFLADIPDSPAKSEVETKLINRCDQLVEVLSRELRTSPDRSLRGGPRVVRRPVLLLIKLQEISKACDLFLTNRSSAMAYAVRQLRTEGSLSLYISKLCKVFFSNLEETAREFRQAFDKLQGCYSSFVVWSCQEISGFVDIFSQQVFGRNAEITEVAECVQNAQAHCSKLHGLGLDLNFQLNNLLMPSILSVLTGHKQKIIDATKLRNSEEVWKPSNMVTPQATEKLIDDMFRLGVKDFENYCYDGCYVRLTGSTIAFTRAIVSHVDSAVKMLLPEIEIHILAGIVDIMRSYTEFTAGSIRSESGRQEKAKLIRENAAFVADSLMPLVEAKIQKKIHQSPRQFSRLRKEFIKEISS
ncbi:unnamed protein product [Clavelina lepadiformis]|uniref:Exocyst component Exo84 C-terminal domain-containing protein n=1 Tax=Clavelina lepadiformis TaxID=159417 RepID=A0ABP0F050_CLALP